MPKRPQSHVTADKAVSRVVSIFTELGWACQTVEHDYGEDVFVQSAVNEQVDPFRLWVQVKGTEDAGRLKNKNGRFVWRVSHDHVLRWIRSLETVVVVLWDIKQNRGFWVKPSEEFSEWDCYMTESKQASLLFSESKIFDCVAANSLVWEARVGHYDLLLTQALAAESNVLEKRKKNPHAYPDFRSKTDTLALDFIRIIGFLGKDGVSLELRQKIKRGAEKFTKDDPATNERKAMLQAVLLTILGLAHGRSPYLGIPEKLLFEAVKVAGVALGVTEAFERGELPDA
jgi:hypothetical protein